MSNRMSDELRRWFEMTYDETVRGLRGELGVPEWYGCDRLGQLAIFINGECGETPRPALPNSDSYLMLIEFFNDESPARQISGFQWDKKPEWSDQQCTDVEESVKTGVFLYACLSDAAFCDPYQLLARPTRPLLLTECPNDIQELVAGVSFNLVFGDEESITVNKHFDYF